MNYLIDSDWIIDGLVGIPRATRVIEEMTPDGLAVSIVTLGEVFEGAFSAPQPAEQLAIFREYLADFAIVPLDDQIMEQFARIRSDLRRHGRLIPDIDLQIAATAITLDMTLVTRNIRHFSRVSDLRLYQAPAET